MSTLKTGTVQNNTGTGAPLFKNNSGTEIGQLVRAYANFDGTFGTSPFTEANGGIRDSFNVTSVTDNGTGDYRINFSNAMANANFSCVGTCGYDDGTYFEPRNCSFFQHATNGVDIHTGYSAFTYQDAIRVEIAVFGD